jgi:L-aspartate oxidase
VRSSKALQAALRQYQAADGWQGELARTLLAAALRRTQSLGAHFLAD